MINRRDVSTDQSTCQVHGDRPPRHHPISRCRVFRAIAPLLTVVALVGCNLGATQQSSRTAQAVQTVNVPFAGSGGTSGPAGTAVAATTAAAQSGGAATTASASTNGGNTAAAAGAQPDLVTGTFTYTNDIITTYYTEHAVALADESGFVKRDLRYVIPVEGQTLGPLSLDQTHKRGNFSVELPESPRAPLVNVAHGAGGRGVEVLVVAYWPNLSGGPFHEGDDKDRGWPSYLASTVNDPQDHNEVTGGKLIVWAPDGNEQFPTDWGPDHKLFTDDDPVGTIPAGYTVVDLDQHPFAFSHEAQPQFTLHEPNDLALKDFSKLSYSAAFQQMFDIVRLEYAFNGIQGKPPEWDSLLAQIKPRVADAEKNHDAKAFYTALQDFTFAFKDGHVGLSGGQIGQQLLQQRAGYGYGFALRQLDDGRFLVTYVTTDGPAAKAGITVGAEVTNFNDQAIAQAVQAVKPSAGPFSTDFALRYQQLRYLLRAPSGTQAKVTYKNPGQNQQTVALTAVNERQSFQATSLYRGFDPNALPVESRLLPSGVGYIRINSNDDDLNLIIRLFERALKTFEANQAPGIIIDMRQNAGGAPLGLAGYLTDKTITMGQLQYYSEKTGKFENEGIPDTVEPNTYQYHPAKAALLVGPACASACELEAYGFSKVPGMAVVGEYPTAGVEAEVARGQFKLPEGISLQVPTGRFVLPDGTIFLEGKGVVPTVHVPLNDKTVLSTDDVILQSAEQAILGK